MKFTYSIGDAHRCTLSHPQTPKEKIYSKKPFELVLYKDEGKNQTKNVKLFLYKVGEPLTESKPDPNITLLMRAKAVITEVLQNLQLQGGRA